jgi:general stress protein 26
MGKPKYRNEIDTWLTSIKYAVSTSYRATKSEELNKYHKVDDEGIRNLTDEEYYDFRVLAAKKFKNRLEEYYNSKDWENLVEDVEKRNVVSALLTDAKEEAIAELNGFYEYKEYKKESEKEEENEEKSTELKKQIRENKKRYKGY